MLLRDSRVWLYMLAEGPVAVGAAHLHRGRPALRVNMWANKLPLTLQAGQAQLLLVLLVLHRHANLLVLHASAVEPAKGSLWCMAGILQGVTTHELKIA